MADLWEGKEGGKRGWGGVSRRGSPVRAVPARCRGTVNVG